MSNRKNCMFHRSFNFLNFYSCQTLCDFMNLINSIILLVESKSNVANKVKLKFVCNQSIVVNTLMLTFRMNWILSMMTRSKQSRKSKKIENDESFFQSWHRLNSFSFSYVIMRSKLAIRVVTRKFDKTWEQQFVRFLLCRHERFYDFWSICRCRYISNFRHY